MCLDISCESSAKQVINMKCQDLFSWKEKNNNNNFKLSSAAVMIGSLRVNVDLYVNDVDVDV